MNAIFELINPANTIAVNRMLAHALGLMEAVVYAALVSKCYYYERNEMLTEDGWFYSTIADLEESTTLSDKQQKRCINSLIDAGLIECRQRGMPAKRYFRVIENIELLKCLLGLGETTAVGLNAKANSSAETAKQETPEAENKKLPNDETCSSENAEHTYKSNINNLNIIQSINPAASPLDEIDRTDNSRDEYLEIIRENIEYNYFEDKSKVDELVEIMLDVVCSTKDTVRVNGEDIPAETVKSRFLKLDSSHIDYVLTALKKSPSDIRNIRAYLITSLYNAPATIDNYYTAWVNHDMHGT